MSCKTRIWGDGHLRAANLFGRDDVKCCIICPGTAKQKGIERAKSRLDIYRAQVHNSIEIK